MRKSDNTDACIGVRVEEYLENLRSRRYSPRSVAIYSLAIRDFVAQVGKDDVRAINRRDLENYRGSLLVRQFKAASIGVYFRAVRLFFRHMEERQHIFANPAEALPFMRTPALLQPVPTEEEMLILLQQPNIGTMVGLRDRALLEMAYSTGLRREELIRLKVGSLDLEKGLARVMGKGQKERVVPVGAEAVKWLREYLDMRSKLPGETAGTALWLAANGRPLGYEALQQLIRRYGRAPGIRTKIGLHSIRRACATHMLRRGASPVAIQLLLGHAALAHLSQYLKVTITDLKQVHEKSRVGQ